ncbi:hypothetical protein MXD63_33785 [Frankia sp. Cpl3]|nr:hypothetical protein [Parafrankia colletiae]MCK9904984.1 hypothetical protein [Frankia sp. Cpl3]
MKEFRADVGPADQQAATDSIERGTTVVAFDDRFRGVQGKGDETAKDQEALRGSDLILAGTSKSQLAGRNEQSDD